MKIKDAADTCWVRGYIQQAIDPGDPPEGGLRLWKNTRTFDEDVESLIYSEPTWECFDPEGDAASIVA